MDFEKDHYEEHDEGSSGKVALVILLILFAAISLPALITSTITYFILFRTLKWKPSFSGIVLFSIIAILSLLGYFIGLFSFQNALHSYIFISILFGFFLGFLVILWQARQLKEYPELKVLKGWAKNFKYSKTPFEIRAKNNLIEDCKNGEAISTYSAPMGVLEDDVPLLNGDKYTKVHLVSRSYLEAFKGTLITGATGSGKTISMLNLMYNDIKAGYPICVIDFKKGPDVAYLLSKWAHEEGRQFYHFTSGSAKSYKNPYCKHKASYDPLATGTSSSKADMMLNLRQWDSASAVYKGRTQSILQSIFYLLEVVDQKALPKIPWEEGGIAQFVAALQAPNLFDMIEWLKMDMSMRETTSGERKRLEQLIAFYQELTASSKSPLREQMDGLAYTCRTLIMSSYSDWLAKGESPNHINLFDLATSDKAPVILFQFNPNEEPEFARHMGSIILADISRVSGQKNAIKNETPFGLYIDEFQTLDPASVAGILEKARSAKFFTTLSLQSLEQIVKASEKNGEATLKSILDTISNFIVHSGASQDSAEEFSKILGMTKITEYKSIGKRDSGLFAINWKNSRKSTVSESLVDAYRLEPKVFQELSSPMPENGFKSTAVFITRECSEEDLAQYPFSIARKIHVVPNDEVLEQIPVDFQRALLSSEPTPKRKVPKDRRDTLKQKQFSNNEKIEVPNTRTDIQNNLKKQQSNKVSADDLPPLGISRKEENSFLNTSMELNKQTQMSQKEFSQKNKRPALEKAKKKTSFDLMTEKKTNNPKLPNLN